MSLSTFFTRKRIPNPTSGNTVFVHGIIFDPGAEAWSPESTVGDPRYTLRVFPQWNFSPLEVYQTPMVFQALSLPDYPYAGFPFGGVLSEGLMHEQELPDVEGDYFS
jgi:hypothetical protein